MDTSFDTVFQVAKELHKFTFKNVICLANSISTEEDYSIKNKDVYKLNEKDPGKNGRFRNVIGACHLCEDNNYNTPDSQKLEKEKKVNEYEKYKLKYVSHGSHSIDFLRASGMSDGEIYSEFTENDWNTVPVLFLMENPSKNYDIYEKRDNKYPSTTWYWIHRKLDSLHEMKNAGDKYLKQGYYGNMVYSLICRNRLANAYLTNAVKCGMNKLPEEEGEQKDGYLGTWWYQDECKAMCAKNVLAKEIQLLTEGQRELIVFAFGNNAYYFAKDVLQHIVDLSGLDKRLILLPHPSNRLNGAFRAVLLGDYVSNALKTDCKIGSLNSITNNEKINLSDIQRALENEGLPCRENKRSIVNNKAALRTAEQRSFLSDETFTTSIYLWTVENIEYGYSFEEESYWITNWNEKNNEEKGKMEQLEDNTFVIFKKVIDKNLLHKD